MNQTIVSDPKIFYGKPMIRGTRMAVSMVLELVEAGISFSEIRAKYYLQLTDEDITAFVTCARQLIEDEEIYFAHEVLGSVKFFTGESI